MRPETNAQAPTKVRGGGADQRPTLSWFEELEIINARLEGRQAGLDVAKSYLLPGWDSNGQPWETLALERDRLLTIKVELGWLSVDAGARVDRQVRAAGEIVDARIGSRISEAALRLRRAEFIMQSAWWSRHWNGWPSWNGLRPSTFPLPLWLLLSAFLLAALGATAWAIFHQHLFPGGEELLPDGQEFGLHQVFFGSALWGFAGGLVAALRTLHFKVQGQQFEIARVAWYVLSPIIGLAFGAIAFLLVLAGLLSTGQDVGGTSAAGEMLTPILILAVLAGLSQNAFLGALQQIVNSRFRGAEEEESP